MRKERETSKVKQKNLTTWLQVKTKEELTCRRFSNAQVNKSTQKQ